LGNPKIKPPSKLVLKISGHIANPDNLELIREYCSAIKEAYSKGVKIAVVVGGGTYARKYINAARSLGASESICDTLGIRVSRLNALLLTSLLKDVAYPIPPENYTEFLKAWSTGKIVICGGFQPGQSTATVAALVAEGVNADVLALAARIDAVYDKDPKIHSDAKKLTTVTTAELKKILEEQSVKAGRYELLDPIAIKVIERSGIPVAVFDGRKVEYFKKLVYEGEIVGTLIKK